MWWIALLGGILGALLALMMLDWALIILSSLIGAKPGEPSSASRSSNNHPLGDSPRHLRHRDSIATASTSGSRGLNDSLSQTNFESKSIARGLGLFDGGSSMPLIPWLGLRFLGYSCAQDPAASLEKTHNAKDEAKKASSSMTLTSHFPVTGLVPIVLDLGTKVMMGIFFSRLPRIEKESSIVDNLEMGLDWRN